MEGPRGGVPQPMQRAMGQPHSSALGVSGLLWLFGAHVKSPGGRVADIDGRSAGTPSPCLEARARDSTGEHSSGQQRSLPSKPETWLFSLGPLSVLLAANGHGQEQNTQVQLFFLLLETNGCGGEEA